MLTYTIKKPRKRSKPIKIGEIFEFIYGTKEEEDYDSWDIKHNRFINIDGEVAVWGQILSKTNIKDEYFILWEDDGGEPTKWKKKDLLTSECVKRVGRPEQLCL